MNLRSAGRPVDPVSNSPERILRERRRIERAMTAENVNPLTMEQMQTKFEEFEKLMVDVKDRGPTLNQLYHPRVDQYHNCGWGGGFDANNFELKPSLISMVQSEQFGGRPNEDANAHLFAFLDICDTIKMNDLPNDVIWLRMFGFSPSKAHRIIFEITHFTQMAEESIYEAWERYRDILRKYPQHGFKVKQQITNFYSGLTQNTKRMVDVFAGGCLVNRTTKEATRITEEMAVTSYQWPSDRQPTQKSTAAVDTRVDDLVAEVTLLKRQVLEERQLHGDVNAVQQQSSDGDLVRMLIMCSKGITMVEISIEVHQISSKGT